MLQSDSEGSEDLAILSVWTQKIYIKKDSLHLYETMIEH